MNLTLRQRTLDRKLEYVVLHGGANARNGPTGSIVASDGAGSYEPGCHDLKLTVLTSIVMTDILQ